MNQIIIEQLKKCRVAKVPPFDENTTHLVIDLKSTKDGSHFIPSHYYIIELDDCLLSKEQSAVLHQNWNNNIFPQAKCLKCECVRVMGDMVKVDGIGYDKEKKADIMIAWGGWLPVKNITVLGELLS